MSNNKYTPGVSAYFYKDVDINGDKIFSISRPGFFLKTACYKKNFCSKIIIQIMRVLISHMLPGLNDGVCERQLASMLIG